MPLPILEVNPVSEVILPEIQKEENASVSVAPVTPQSYDEPIITQRELWSYYCVYHYLYISFFYNIIDGFSSVYSFGNNVRFSSPALYPEHRIQVLIFDSCVQYAGTRTPA